MKTYKIVRYDDRERKLEFTFNAISDFEITTGLSLVDMSGNKMGFSTLRAIIWAGLKEDDETLTIKTTGEMLQKALQTGKITLADLGKDITDALIASGILKAKKSKEDKTEGNA